MLKNAYMLIKILSKNIYCTVLQIYEKYYRDIRFDYFHYIRRDHEYIIDDQNSKE